MKYRDIRAYKFQVYETEVTKTPIIPEKEIYHEFFMLLMDGTLTVKKGYAWDGASGPVIQTKALLKASLAHDVFFQCMRVGLLPKSYFEVVNKFLQIQCIQFGMNKLFAWGVYQAVQTCGKKYIEPRPEDKNPVMEI